MRQKYKRLHFIFFGITLCLLGLSGLTSLQYYVLDSEFWSITIAKELFNLQTDQIGLYYKIPFYLYLNIPLSFAKNNIETIAYSRLAFVFISWLATFYTFQFALFTLKNRAAAYTAVAILYSTTYYFVHSNQVRSDIFACVFFLYLLNHLNEFSKNPRQLSIFEIGKITLISLLMAATTPKSFFLYILLMGACATHLKYATKTEKPYIQRVWTFLFLPPVAISLLLLIFYSTIPNRFSEAYLSATQLFLNNLMFGFTDYYNLRVFFVFNSIFAISLLLSVILLMRFQLISKTSSLEVLRHRCLLYTLSILSLLIVLLHSQRLQFFIAIFLPIFSVTITYVLLQICRKLRLRRSLLLLILFTALVKSIFIYRYASVFHSNKRQLGFIQDLEKYVNDYNEAKYYDVIGLLPLKQQHYAYISPNDGAYEFHTKKIIQHNPDIIVQTVRLNLLGESMKSFLARNFLQIHRDFWVKKLNFEAEGEKFIDGKRYSTYSLARLLQDLEQGTSYSFHVYGYEKSKDQLFTPVPILIFDIKNRVTLSFPGGVNIADFARELFIEENRSLQDYVLIFDSTRHQFSLFKPFHSEEFEKGIQFLFAYQSQF